MTILVSILTPSFNQAEWLGDNLRSVSTQTYANIEHIVMDGGSTDSSAEILRQTDSSVIWRSERDRGQSHALNKAFDASSGEIIGWINSDDAYADVNVIARIVEAFESNPEVGVVFGASLAVDAENRVLHYNAPTRANQTGLDLADFLIQPAVFMRRSVITPPLVNEKLRYIMDLDLWLRLLSTTKFIAVPHVIALDRHQMERKTLEGAYPQELAEYMGKMGVSYSSPMVALRRKAKKILLRLQGAPGAWTLSGKITPGVELHVPPRWRLMTNQLILPRRLMV